jgi:hypothetical protein
MTTNGGGGARILHQRVYQSRDYTAFTENATFPGGGRGRPTSRNVLAG